MRRTMAALAVSVLTVTGCGDGSGTGGQASASTTTSPASTTTTAAERPSAQTCTATTHTVEYPEGWHTNSDRVVPLCSFFHPEPFEVPEATEVTGFAVALKLEEVPYAVVSGPSSADRELSRMSKTVGGRPAVAVEGESTGEALLDRGTRTYRYAVDLGDRAFTGTTYGVEGLDYEGNKRVLDDMMASLMISG